MFLLLVQLSLQDNVLTDVPASITKLTNLTELVLSENNLQSFPKILLSLSITRLSVGNNKLSSIPEDCTGEEPLFKSLEQLVLSHNEFTVVPFKFLSHFKALQKLDLQFNPIGSTVGTPAQPQVDALPKADNKETTTTTTIESPNTTAVVESPSAEVKKEEPVVEDKKEEQEEELTDVVEENRETSPSETEKTEENPQPAATAAAETTAVSEPSSVAAEPTVASGGEEPCLPQSLTELLLNNCQLTSVPHFLYQFRNVKKLNLSNNNIKEFEPPLSDLSLMTSLQTLEMNVNKLTDIPEELCNVTSLTELRIEDNSVKCIPDSIGSLKNLKNFEFMGNRIQTLPDSFAQLSSLKCIDLMYNRLETLPPALLNMPQERISYLALAGNKFETVPPEVEAKCDKVTVADPDPPVEIVKDVLFLGSYRTSKSFFQLQKNNIRQVLIIAHNIKPPYPGVCS